MGELLRVGPAGPALPDLALECWGLRKSYDGRTVVDVDHLAVQTGEVLALLGPNGAGKSTIFRLLALLEEPDAGRISHFGREVTWRDLEARRRIATVFQRPVFFAGTVKDNAAYGLRLRGERGDSAEAKTARTLDLLGMLDFLEADVRTLSGGELQRVALARALVLDPEILFLDEPTSNLDPGVRRVLREDLRDIVAKLEMTVVLITHDQSEAFNLATRVAVVRDGRVVQEGEPDDVFLHPRDSFVADFLGLETVWRGRVTRAAERLCEVEFAPGLTAEVVANAQVGERLAVTMRPEDVSLSLPTTDRSGPASSVRNHWSGQVDSTSYAGPLVRVKVRLDAEGDEPSLVALVTRTSAEELGLAPGQDVVAHVKATALHPLQV